MFCDQAEAATELYGRRKAAAPCSALLLTLGLRQVLLESITVLVLVSIVFAKIQNRIVDDSNDQVCYLLSVYALGLYARSAVD